MDNIDIENKRFSDCYINQCSRIDGQFLAIPYSVFDNDALLKKHACSYLLYQFLRRYVIKFPSKKDYLNLYSEYYLKDKLASGYRIDKLSKKFGKSDKQIRRWIKELEKEGAFKVHKKDRHNIYEMGYIKDGVEHYFYDSYMEDTKLETADIPVKYDRYIPVKNDRYKAKNTGQI